MSGVIEYAGEHEMLINDIPFPYAKARVRGGKGGYKKIPHQTRSKVKFGKAKKRPTPVSISLDFGIFLNDAPDLTGLADATFKFSPTESGGKTHVIFNVDFSGDPETSHDGEDSSEALTFEGTHDDWV